MKSSEANQTQRMSTSLPTFETAVRDGTLIREGMRVDNHACVLRSAVKTTAGGRKKPYHGESLGVGEQVERNWACHKSGFARRLNMDDFEHRETFGKPSCDAMRVNDHLSWHGGASVVQRSYQAKAIRPHGIAVTMAPWQVHMAGIGGKVRWLRGQIERTMRSQLPKQVDKPHLTAIAKLHNQPANNVGIKPQDAWQAFCDHASVWL